MRIMQDCKLKKVNSCFFFQTLACLKEAAFLASDAYEREVIGMTDNRATKPLLKLIHSLGTTS